MDEEIRKKALEYHRFPKPGKIQVSPTKALSSQRDLALAYSRVLQLPATPSLKIQAKHAT